MGFGQIISEDEKIIKIGNREVNIRLITFETGIQQIKTNFCDKQEKYLRERLRKLLLENINLKKQIENGKDKTDK